jgi:hypothetical protein
MRRLASRTAWGSAAALVASLALGASPAAGATEVRLLEEIDEPRFFEAANIAISAERARNSIRVGFDRPRQAFVIRDRVRVQAPGCKRLSRSAVRCDVDYEEVYVDSGGGDDRVKIRSAVPATAGISGGVGNDVLIGGRDDDEIEGGRGDDDLRGNAGQDDLDGDAFSVGKGDDVLRGGKGGDSVGGFDEAGSDVFLGGAGNDNLDAKDGRRDARLDCGPGRADSVDLDAVDPRARSCEQ